MHLASWSAVAVLAELAQVAKGETTEGLCHASTGYLVQHLGGATTAVLEVPPGARRCVFLQTTGGDVVAVRADVDRTTTKVLKVPPDDFSR